MKELRLKQLNFILLTIAIGLILFFLMVVFSAHASAFSGSIGYYTEPYTSTFEDGGWYNIASGSINAHYILNNGATYWMMGGVYKGIIGSSIEVSDQPFQCSTGTCEIITTENYGLAWPPTNGDLYYAVIFKSTTAQMYYDCKDYFEHGAGTCADYQTINFTYGENGDPNLNTVLQFTDPEGYYADRINIPITGSAYIASDSMNFCWDEVDMEFFSEEQFSFMNIKKQICPEPMGSVPINTFLDNVYGNGTVYYRARFRSNGYDEDGDGYEDTTSVSEWYYLDNPTETMWTFSVGELASGTPIEEGMITYEPEYVGTTEGITQFETIFGDKIPFSYFYDIKNLVDQLNTAYDYTASTSENELTSISITFPAITELKNTKFEIPIVNQDMIFKILPKTTWNTIREFIQYGMYIGLFFWTFNTIKKFIEQITKIH